MSQWEAVKNRYTQQRNLLRGASDGEVLIFSNEVANHQSSLTYMII